MRVGRLGVWYLVVALWIGSIAAAADKSSDAELRKELDRAAQAFEQGRYEEARKAYQHVTEQDPGSIRAWTGLGWSLWQLGQRDRAMKIWTDLLKVSPNEPKILLAIAQAQEQNGALNDALASYERLLKQKAETREAHLGRARILERMGNPAAAEADFQAVLDQTPGDVNAQFGLARVYLATNRNADAERLLKQLTSVSPQPKYLRLLGDGMLALGRYDEAANYYKRSLAADPDHRGTVLNLARSYARNYRYAEAADTLKPYLDRHPDDDAVREELAKDAGDAENFAEATRQWQTLARQHPEEIKFQVGLAKTYRAAGKFDDALQIAREVIGKDPKNVDALALLADDAALAGRQEEAIRWLEQLLAAEAKPERANQLGRLRLGRGDRFANEGDEEHADVEYRAAARAFEISNRLDPTGSDAALGLVSALRLSHDTDRAAALGERFIQHQPDLEPMQRELFETYSQVGDYDNAEKYLKLLRKDNPGNVLLEQQQALIEFNRGEQHEAIEHLQKVLRSPIQRRVPILLYHGISRYPRTPSAMPVENFRDQMVALKKQGYNTITVDQLLAFLDGKGTLPPKPILITFDDARADTVRNADPIFQELGFRGAIFIPAGEIGQHGPYYAPWRTLVELQQSGRWEMQCHAWMGHRHVPTDAEGRTQGLFFTDRQWLADKQRLETVEEFRQRLDADYKGCREIVERQIPGARVTAYAYPFGDLGQRRFNNERSAIDTNLDLVAKYYRVAFVENPSGMALPSTPRYRMPRYEMPVDSKGEDLLRILRTADPENSTLFMIATLNAWSGRFADAEALFADLEKRGFDRATLLATEGQVRQWNGDFAGAREMLTTAAELRPDDPGIQRKIEALNLHVRPLAEVDASYYHDNRDRSNYGIGPQGKVWLTDRFSISAQYQYRDFKHSNFSLDQLPSAQSPSPATPTSPSRPASGTGTTSPTTSPAGSGTQTVAQTAAESPKPTADLEARGNQFEGQLEYGLDWRTSFAIGAGVADFQDRSRPKVLQGPETVALVSGRANLGLGPDTDLAFGGSRGYVPAAGTILDRLTYEGGFGLLRWRPIETYTLELQGGAEHYSDDNERVSAHARVTKLFWADPDIELGYQFVYDNAKDQNPFFYTPDQFIANEAVFSLRLAPDKPLSLVFAGAVGEGSERQGNAVVEGSAAGGIELNLMKRLRLTLNGGRTQSARFRSYELSGGIAARF